MDGTVPEKSRPQPKGGSRKGIPNKVNADVKAMVLEALHHAGGAEYLCMQAYDNPKAFLALVGRVLPLSLANQDGGPLAGVVLVPMKAPATDA
jgi:hypothetical protein